MPEVFVPYFRVSTDQQGRSGLGLDAQRRAVGDYLRTVGGQALDEFIEVESGRRGDRPALQRALALARRRKATLLVATLDRLARNTHFITSLQQSGVSFRAVDMPQANEFMVQILAAVAEYEARLISERTKAGLASARARGVRLGKPENLARGNHAAAREQAARADGVAARMRPVIAALRAEGHTTIRAIVRQLHERGYQTERGSEWHPTTVSRLLRRLATPSSPLV
jgi:DNA invertase Pin-like site-specific DNA recombinase